jgi:hypothetical protein
VAYFVTEPGPVEGELKVECQGQQFDVTRSLQSAKYGLPPSVELCSSWYSKLQIALACRLAVLATVEGLNDRGMAS